MQSLEILLEIGGITLPEKEKNESPQKKMPCTLNM
jgi:hypothetical protein